jgi:hypothetical protein
MTDYLIKNARLVNEGTVTEGDLLARGQWIERIDRGIPVPPGVEVVDAAGLTLLPGMIDDQVHFRDPGLTHKADMVTEYESADRHPGGPGGKIQACRGALSCQFRLLSRSHQRQRGRDTTPASRPDLRHQGIHGGLHR